MLIDVKLSTVKSVNFKGSNLANVLLKTDWPILTLVFRKI